MRADSTAFCRMAGIRSRTRRSIEAVIKCRWLSTMATPFTILPRRQNRQATGSCLCLRWRYPYRIGQEIRPVSLEEKRNFYGDPGYRHGTEVAHQDVQQALRP